MLTLGNQDLLTLHEALGVYLTSLHKIGAPSGERQRVEEISRALAMMIGRSSNYLLQSQPQED